MGSKSAPSTDTSAYASIYNLLNSESQTSAAQSQASLDWSKQQWVAEQPYTNAYMNAMIGSTNAETAAAQNAQNFYYSTYQPIETQFAQTAQNYNTPERAQQQSAAAQADVAASYSTQRSSALQNLESYGIDPSQTRYGAMDLGARISQAGAQASAATQSRLNTEQTGLSLEANAINTGRGYSSSIAQAYNTATSAGSSGVNAGNQTSSTYGNLMGTPVQWGSLSTNQANSASNTVNTAYSNELASYNASTAASQNTSSGIGSLVGGLGMAALLKYSDERLKTDIQREGTTQGGIPIVSFRFKTDPTHERHVGVLAKDVEKRIPGAVLRDSGGIKIVDYARVR